MWSWFMFLTNKSWRAGTTKAEVFPLGWAKANPAPGERRGSRNHSVWGGFVKWRKQMDDLMKTREDKMNTAKIKKGRHKKCSSQNLMNSLKEQLDSLRIFVSVALPSSSFPAVCLFFSRITQKLLSRFPWTWWSRNKPSVFQRTYSIYGGNRCASVTHAHTGHSHAQQIPSGRHKRGKDKFSCNWKNCIDATTAAETMRSDCLCLW